MYLEDREENAKMATGFGHSPCVDQTHLEQNRHRSLIIALISDSI